MLTARQLSASASDTIHHLFLGLYGQHEYELANEIKVELVNKYSFLEQTIDSIGYKGISISDIADRAFGDVESGLYSSIVAQYDSVNTLEFFSMLYDIKRELMGKKEEVV